MRKSTIHRLGAAATIAALGVTSIACAPNQAVRVIHEPDPGINVDKPPCVGSVVVVQEDADTDCNVRPPQTINVIMHDKGDGVIQRCEAMGGTFKVGPSGKIAWCEDVDY